MRAWERRYSGYCHLVTHSFRDIQFRNLLNWYSFHWLVVYCLYYTKISSTKWMQQIFWSDVMHLSKDVFTLMPPPTGTHQLRSGSRSMNRRKRGHMSKESLTLNMPLLRLLSYQPVVGSVRKLPPSISDLPLSSLINGTSPTAPQWTGWDPSVCFNPLYNAFVVHVPQLADLTAETNFRLVKFISCYFPLFTASYYIFK